MTETTLCHSLGCAKPANHSGNHEGWLADTFPPASPSPAPEKCLICGEPHTGLLNMFGDHAYTPPAPIPAEQEKLFVCFHKHAPIKSDFESSYAAAVRLPRCEGASPSPAPTVQRGFDSQEEAERHGFIHGVKTFVQWGRLAEWVTDKTKLIALGDKIIRDTDAGSVPAPAPQRGTEEKVFHRIHRVFPPPDKNMWEECPHPVGSCIVNEHATFVPAAQLATMREEKYNSAKDRVVGYMKLRFAERDLSAANATIAELREELEKAKAERDEAGHKLGSSYSANEKRLISQLSTATSRLQRFERLRLKTYILMSSAHARLLMYKCKDSGYVMDSLRDWKTIEEAFLAAPVPDVLDKRKKL